MKTNLFSNLLWAHLVLLLICSAGAQAQRTDRLQITPAISTDASEVVGSVGGVEIKWGQVIDFCRKENSSGYKQAVAQAIQDIIAAARQKGISSSSVSEAQALAWLRKTPPALLGDTLNTMLAFDAVDREAKKQGITVTTAQVDARIDRFLQTLHSHGRTPQGGSDAQFLNRNHAVHESLRENFLVVAKLHALIQHDFVEKRLGHTLTPNDFFQVRHILIKIPAAIPGQKPEEVQKAEDDALAKIKQIAVDIAGNKKTFEQAAQESSEDEGSKEIGGSLGVQLRTALAPEFENAVYLLKPDEVSQPVKSQFGYHLIQLEQRGAEIPEPERQQYLDHFEAEQVQIFLRDLLTKYHAVNRLSQPSK